MGTQPIPETQSAEAPYYVWEPAGKPVSIRLHFDVIDQVLPEVMRGFGALPRRGAEVGGLLLGHVEDGPRGTVVAITGIEPVNCEYLMGPSYHLSDRDRRNLESALERHGRDVVGFFRSHTRKDLCLDDADAGLLARYFAGPQNVLLLVKPFATRTSLAGFFFWEDGEIQREASYQEFPFHRRDLGGTETPGGGARRTTPVAVHPPVFALPVEPESAVVAPEVETHDLVAPERRQTVRPVAFAVAGEYPPVRAEEIPVLPQADFSRLSSSPLSILSQPPLLLPAGGPRRVRLGWWFWAPIALTIVVMAGTAGFVASKTLVISPARNADPTLPLKLLVNEHPTQSYLEIAWDRTAPAVFAARRGLLTIQDGGNKRELELSADELKLGRVRYSRLTGDVALRLEVVSERETVSESMRVVTGEPVLRAAPVDQTPVPPATAQNPPGEALRKPAEPVARIPEPSAGPLVAPAKPDSTAPEGRKRARRAISAAKKAPEESPPGDSTPSTAVPPVDVQAKPAPLPPAPTTEPPPAEGADLPRPARRR